jgi:retinol dehydrogenase 12
MRHNTSSAYRLYLSFMIRLLARTAEEGGRTLVFAAYGGQDTHGKYLDHCKIGRVSPYIVSGKGLEVQKKLWKELSAKLEEVEPGVLSLI